MSKTSDCVARLIGQKEASVASHGTFPPFPHKEFVLDLLSLHVSRLLVTRELKTRLLQLLEADMVGCAVFVKFCRAKSCFSLSLGVKSLGRACLSAQELPLFATFQRLSVCDIERSTSSQRLTHAMQKVRTIALLVNCKPVNEMQL